MPPGELMYMSICFLGFSALQEQQLGADQRRDAVVDRAVQEDHPLAQQAREDVEGALAAAGLLDHHRHEVHGRGRRSRMGDQTFSRSRAPANRAGMLARISRGARAGCKDRPVIVMARLVRATHAHQRVRR